MDATTTSRLTPPAGTPPPVPLPLIYIAGPFRSPTPLGVRRNVEEARDYGFLVAQCGGYPVIPHTMTADFDKQLTDAFWLQGTMALLQRCDGLLATPRWGMSTGARHEVNWATLANVPVYYMETTTVPLPGNVVDAPELVKLRAWIARVTVRLESATA